MFLIEINLSLWCYLRLLPVLGENLSIERTLYREVVTILVLDRDQFLNTVLPATSASGQGKALPRK
jgi:hypothetical protein